MDPDFAKFLQDEFDEEEQEEGGDGRPDDDADAAERLHAEQVPAAACGTALTGLMLRDSSGAGA